MSNEINMSDATIDDIVNEIKNRYTYNGGMSGVAVIVTDIDVVVSDHATRECLMELAGVIYTLAKYME